MNNWKPPVHPETLPLGLGLDGYVYFIACEALDAVKIGYTRLNPKLRLQALQTASPAPLRLLAFVPGNMEVERRLHETFAALRLEGEWFLHRQKLKDLIQYLDHEYGVERPTPWVVFHGSIHDCVLSGGFEYPDRDDLEGYAESGVSHPWPELIRFYELDEGEIA